MQLHSDAMPVLYPEILKGRIAAGELPLHKALAWLCSHGMDPQIALKALLKDA